MPRQSTRPPTPSCISSPGVPRGRVPRPNAAESAVFRACCSAFGEAARGLRGLRWGRGEVCSCGKRSVFFYMHRVFVPSSYVICESLKADQPLPFPVQALWEDAKRGYVGVWSSYSHNVSTFRPFVRRGQNFQQICCLFLQVRAPCLNLLAFDESTSLAPQSVGSKQGKACGCFWMFFPKQCGHTRGSYGRCKAGVLRYVR